MKTTSPVPTPESTGHAVARATAGIGAFNVLRLVVGFVTTTLIANNLGLKKEADIYNVAIDIVSSLWLGFEKTINAAVLPLFGRSLKEDGEASAWRFGSATLAITVLLVLILAPLAWFGMPWIVDLYSQKSDASQRALTVELARLGLAGLGFLAVSSLTYVFLNAYKRFAAAALGDLAWKLGILFAAVYALVTKAPLDAVLPILTWGFILGSVLKLAPQVWALREKLKLLTAKIDWSDPRIRAAFWLAVPLLLGVVISESRDVFRNWIADSPLIVDAAGDQVEGSRSALKFSRLISSSLIGVFPYALSIGIFPFLADLATNKDREGFTRTLVGALRVCIFVFAPITAILIALRFPLLRAVLEGGRMSTSDTLVLTAPFVAYALGLMGLACENVLNQSFYAQTRAWTPTLIGIATSLLFVIIAWSGVTYLAWGLAAIAGAESVSKTVKCLVMWRLLKPNLGNIQRRENFVFFLKVAFGSLLAALLAQWLIGFLAPDEGAARFKLKMLLAVTIAGIGGMSVFALFATLARVDEMKFLRPLAAKFRRL